MTGLQNGRPVSLVCLKSMNVDSNGPCPVLLDHLPIPIGVGLEIRVDLPSSLIKEHLPRSLDKLKNFSDFTTIKSHLGGYYTHKIRWTEREIRHSPQNFQRQPDQISAWIPRGVRHLEDQTARSRLRRPSDWGTSSPSTPSHERPAHPQAFSLQYSTHFHSCLAPRHKFVGSRGLSQTG